MNPIKKLDYGLMKAEEFILSFAIIAIFVLVTGNALSRRFLGTSWPFSSELAEAFVYLATFMGISYAARKGRHIRMSAFFDIAPYKVKKALSIIIPFVTALVLFALAYYSLGYLEQTTNRVTTALRLPYYIILLPVPVGLTLGGLQFLRNMWINIIEKEIYIGTEMKESDRE
ncbi:TRAP-type C4-dicarboxylate transport system permease small subunit [Salsuginibacillus halophilus]|uniref:TRAP-type C4-dicarboxylate transport system permease small subunit n=1 Tax=Salsuginibacillus halophilus TaxID=517424 RepID=A0A2P8HE78_9BACI|nr:TRAP transporter small permease [Salsuginibacillus halophilus]PSL44471.1 TRAP-type C4-dicarboxylate transport system permease small subunit [Salsuginibacillus halophilus]